MLRDGEFKAGCRRLGGPGTASRAQARCRIRDVKYRTWTLCRGRLPMRKDTIRLGLIGSTGHWQTYTPAITNVPGLSLIAVAAAGPEETTGALDHARPDGRHPPLR